MDDDEFENAIRIFMKEMGIKSRSVGFVEFMDYLQLPVFDLWWERDPTDYQDTYNRKIESIIKNGKFIVEVFKARRCWYSKLFQRTRYIICLLGIYLIVTYKETKGISY